MNGFLDNDFFFESGLDFLRGITDVKEGLTAIVRSAAATVGSDCASLYLVDDSTAALEPYILINVPDAYLQGCASVPLGTQCCGRAALHRVPWAVVDMWNDPLFADCADAARKSGMRSGLSVPVMLGEECVATLAVQFQHVFQANQADVARLSMFARLISMAVLNDIEAQNLDPKLWVSRQLETGPIAA